MNKQLDDALRYVLADIEDSKSDEVVAAPVVTQPVDPSEAQRRIDALRNSKYAAAAKKASQANNVDDFLDSVIQAEGAKKGIFALDGEDYDVYGSL